MLRGDGGYGAASSARPLRQGQTGSLAPFESLPVSTGPGEAGRAYARRGRRADGRRGGERGAGPRAIARGRGSRARVQDMPRRLVRSPRPPGDAGVRVQGRPAGRAQAVRAAVVPVPRRRRVRGLQPTHRPESVPRGRRDEAPARARHTRGSPGLSRATRRVAGTGTQRRAEARTRPPRTPPATTPRRLQTTTPRSAGATTRRILERQPMVILPAKPPKPSRVVFGGEARDEARHVAGSGTASSAARSSLRTRFTIPTRDPTFVRDPTSRRAPHAHMRRDVSIASFVVSTRRDPREVSRYATSRRWSPRSLSRRRF
jgi:hypothetical protein